MLVTIRPAPGGIGGVIAAPPSKSMAHRAVLCAALADKDVAGIVDVLVPAFPRVVVTQTDSDRALPAEELAALVDADKLAGVYPSVSEALAAFEAAGEPFVAAGTITLAGEVAGLLR